MNVLRKELGREGKSKSKYCVVVCPKAIMERNRKSRQVFLSVQGKENVEAENVDKINKSGPSRCEEDKFRNWLAL